MTGLVHTEQHARFAIGDLALPRGDDQAIVELSVISKCGILCAGLLAYPSIRESIQAQNDKFELKPTVAFVSTRDNPTGNPLLASEIYLGCDVTRDDGVDGRRGGHHGMHLRGSATWQLIRWDVPP